MLLAGTKTNVNGFGWQHLCELLKDTEIDALVESGLTERERQIIDYCTKVAYSFDHDDSRPAYAGSGANIASCISSKFFGSFNNGHDYGSPYTTHNDCQCVTCRLVRKSNAVLNSPFNCRVCGRHDDSTDSKPSAEQWVCAECTLHRFLTASIIGVT